MFLETMVFQSSKVWPAVAIVLSLLVGVFGHAALTSPDTPVVAPNVTTVQYDDSAVKAALNETQAKLDALAKETLKEDFKEEFAKSLVNEEMFKSNGKVSRDFAETLQEFLNDELAAANNTDEIESYKDIFNVVVKDADWTVSGNDASVDLELKVEFYLDGDEDSENYALVEVSLDVSDLDEDDSYEDAEVDSYDASDFSLKRFKFD